MAQDAGKKIVYIVDDNAGNRKLSRDLLELNGFDVVVSESGEELLEKLKGSRPDLILMDITLPDINGFDLFKKLRESTDYKEIKVIAWTAMAMKEEQDKIRAAGFDHYISKPIDTKNFVKEIKTLLAA